MCNSGGGREGEEDNHQGGAKLRRIYTSGFLLVNSWNGFMLLEQPSSQ